MAAVRNIGPADALATYGVCRSLSVVVLRPAPHAATSGRTAMTATPSVRREIICGPSPLDEHRYVGRNLGPRDARGIERPDPAVTAPGKHGRVGADSVLSPLRA